MPPNIVQKVIHTNDLDGSSAHKALVFLPSYWDADSLICFVATAVYHHIHPYSTYGTYNMFQRIILLMVEYLPTHILWHYISSGTSGEITERHLSGFRVCGIRSYYVQCVAIFVHYLAVFCSTQLTQL